MVYYPNSTCLGLTEQLTQLRIMPYRYETGEMTAVSARMRTRVATRSRIETDRFHSIT